MDLGYISKLSIVMMFVFSIILSMATGVMIGYNLSNKSNELAPSPLSKSSDSEITACSGIDEQEKERVAYHRILLATSSDGLNFTRLNQIISDRASVPDIMIDKDGNIRIYFIQVSCKEQNLKNNPIVAISQDQGKNWDYKRLNIEAPEDAPKCQEPNGNPPPVDPDVVLMPDKTYRLYSTCPTGASIAEHIPQTFVFTSSDGINFKNGVSAFIPKEKRALDPVTLKTNNMWHLYDGDAKGNTLHATSEDGISFEEKEKFCPFTFDAQNGQSKCYITGDTLTLEDSTRYRIYLFGNTPEEGFKSIISTDGENWTMEQKKDEYILNVDNNSEYESREIASPTVVKLADGSYLMAYESVIPGAPEVKINNRITNQN